MTATLLSLSMARTDAALAASIQRFEQRGDRAAAEALHWDGQWRHVHAAFDSRRVAVRDRGRCYMPEANDRG